MEQPHRFGNHDNGFGFLRLVFASLVILSHTPELIDGNRHRELLTQAFGTLSFGDFAVACFFIISGWLITGTYINNPTLKQYFINRSARIYPAFLCVSFICLMLVSPLGGMLPWCIPLRTLALSLFNIAVLQPMPAVGAFKDSHYPLLDGPVWTLAYEFRCYILVPIFSALALLSRRRVFVIITAALWLIQIIQPVELFTIWNKLPAHGYYIGNSTDTVKLTATFMTGSCFILFRDQLVFKNFMAVIAATALAACLSNTHFSSFGLAVFGGYLIFYTAFKAAGTPFASINNKNDISYGVYLYAWPITKILLWWFPNLSIFSVNLITLIIAFLCGLASWHFLEKPIMRVVKARMHGEMPA